MTPLSSVDLEPRASVASRRLRDLLTRLPHDTRPHAEVATSLLDALQEALVLPTAAAWRHHYETLLEIFRVTYRLELHHHDQETPRRTIESHAWRVAQALGLDIAKHLPWPVAPGADGFLAPKDGALLWCWLTRQADPWPDLDLTLVQSLPDGSHDPILRALWRLGTGAHLGRLQPRHRTAFEHAKDGALCFARLAFEEARDLTLSTGQTQSLEYLDLFLHDPILQCHHAAPTLELLSEVVLAQARAHIDAGRLGQARRFLGQWESLDQRLKLRPAERIVAAEARARLDVATFRPPSLVVH